MKNTKGFLLLTGAAILIGTAACGTAPAHDADRAQAARPPGLIIADAQLAGLALASPQRGTGLFDTSKGSHCQAVAARTTDGGARFGSPAVITSWNCAGTAPVTSLTADAAGDEFAYGPRLFISRNGVGTWRASPQPGAVLAVSALGRSVWMLLARCGGATCRLVLAESANGGRTWRASRSQPARAIVPAGPGGQYVSEPAVGQTWLLRTGLASGYVLARPVTNNRGKADEAPLWYTANGGASWSPRRLPCGLDALSDVASAAPGRALIAVCSGEPSAGWALKSTATSANGGRTWTVHVPCPQVAAACREPLESGYLGAIDAISARTAYLTGDRSDLLVTSDGGRRWRLALPEIGGQWSFTEPVIFFGRSDGVLVGADGNSQSATIWHTSDGGRRWSTVIPALSPSRARPLLALASH